MPVSCECRHEAGPVPTPLLMLVPTSLDRAIFPWGPWLVFEYAQKQDPRRRCTFLDLRKEQSVVNAGSAALPLLRELFLALPSPQRTLFMGHSPNPALLLDLIGALGGQVWQGLEAPGGAIEEAAALSDTFGEALTDVIKPHLMTVSAPVCGISVYDYTALGALTCAKRIKQIRPDCQIVLGGDYITEPVARTLIEGVPFVDAVVIGYGEEVMSDILVYADEGRRLSEIQHEAIVSRRADSQEGAMKFLPPRHYGSLGSAPPVRYAALSDGKVRVLTQRGCSWGECTFCSQIDRRSYYPVRLRELLEAMPSLVPEAALSGRVQVSFDADENDLARVIPLAEAISDALADGDVADIEFWLMVRSFRIGLCDLALRLRGRLNFQVRLNIESLSIDRLRLMKKGFSPLQALEALKALIDCGQRISTNYFSFYPGEGNGSAASSEAELLRLSSHLLLHPSVTMSAFSYAMNGRDTIAEDPERFGLATERLPGDDWLARAFGVDLPFSIWAHQLAGSKACSEAVRAEMGWADARKRLAASRLGLHLLSDTNVPASEANLLLQAELEAVRSAGRLLGEICRAPAESSRAQRISTMNALEVLKSGGKSFTPAAGAYLLHAELRIEGTRMIRRLHKEDQGQCLDLTANDLSLLRFIYWVRRTSEIAGRFPGSEARLKALAEMGVVAEQRGHWLCLAQDPEYWRDEAARRERPVRLLEPENRSRRTAPVAAASSALPASAPASRPAGS